MRARRQVGRKLCPPQCDCLPADEDKMLIINDRGDSADDPLRLLNAERWKPGIRPGHCHELSRQ